MRLIAVVLCVSWMHFLSGCAVVSVVDTAVGVTSTVVSTTVDVAAGAVGAVAGSSKSDKSDDDDEDCRKADKDGSSKKKCKDE